jgi:hypothetical protein
VTLQQLLPQLSSTRSSSLKVVVLSRSSLTLSLLQILRRLQALLLLLLLLGRNLLLLA